MQITEVTSFNLITRKKYGNTPPQKKETEDSKLLIKQNFYFTPDTHALTNEKS
jgi:hypothetical protein